MLRRSLQLRLTVLVALLTVLALLLFASAFYVLLRSTLEEAVDMRLTQRASLATSVLNTSSLQLDEVGPLLAPVPLREFDAPGIYVEVIDPTGNVLAASPNLAAGSLPKAPALLAQARAGQPAFGAMSVNETEQLRLLVQPLIDSEAPPGTVLLVAESLEPLERTLAQTSRLLVGTGAITLAGIVVVVALLTGYALRPMARLTATTARIADTGHYDERVPPAPHPDEVGRLTATVNTLIHTVEQTLAQQRQLLADTSHELRSPLTVVLANLDLLRRDLAASERDQSVYEAVDEAQRMRRLINDLLLLAQSDAVAAIERTPVLLDQLAAETIDTVARQHVTHHYCTALSPDVVVQGDAERLRQLLRNLLENAARHTPPGSTVTVRLQTANGQAILQVEDDGPGIPAADLPHIWDRFYRVDKTRSRVHGGSGLGLAIVRFLAVAHGGHASVRSVLGGGSCFTVTLPLDPAILGRSDQSPVSLQAGQRQSTR